MQTAVSDLYFSLIYGVKILISEIIKFLTWSIALAVPFKILTENIVHNTGFFCQSKIQKKKYSKISI